MLHGCDTLETDKNTLKIVAFRRKASIFSELMTLVIFFVAGKDLFAARICL